MSPGVQGLQRELQAAICSDAPLATLAPGLLRSPAATGLAIYREACVARLVAALRDNYLVLHRAMGDEAFDALARAYCQAHPSSHASLRWFGDQLAAFMAGAHAEFLPHPAMPDFARMDWALRAAFDGPSAPLLRAEDLRSVAPQDWPGLVFQLQPTACLHPLDWAIEPAWRALRAHEPESGEPAPELAAPVESAHLLLVWRQDLETRWRALEPLEAALLRVVGESQSFEQLCACAAEQVGEAAAAATVVHSLQRWLAEQLLAKP